MLPYRLTAPNPSKAMILLHGHEDPILSIAISSDSHWLVTGSADYTARLWDLTSRPDPAENAILLRGHEDRINAVAISPDKRWLVTGSADRTARLWDLTTADPSHNAIVLRGHENSINAVAITPDNHWVVTGTRGTFSDFRSGEVRMSGLTSSDPSLHSIVLLTRGTNIDAITTSPGHRWLVAEGDEGGYLWDLSTPDPTKPNFKEVPVDPRRLAPMIAGLSSAPPSRIWLPAIRRRPD